MENMRFTNNQEILAMIRIPSLAPILPRVFSLTPRFGTVLTQFRGWMPLKPGLRSLRNSVLGSPVPPLSTTPVPQVSREPGRPKGSPPGSPKMEYEPGSPKQREKPIAEISSGSVTIPIYASPVTVKLGKKSSQKAGVDSKPDDGGSDCKTYPSFKIVYYEGTRRIFRRRSTLAKAKALAKELAGQLACDGVRSEYLTEQDRRIYVLAQKAVQPLNLEIDQACRLYADLRTRVKGATLEEAVDFHNTFGQRVRHGATTEEVYQEYLQHLEKRGAGDYHVRDVDRLVGGLVNAFPGPIARIDTPDIDDFLSRRGGKSRNKNNWRRGIIAYFNFAQKKNFLPKNLEHAAAATCEFSDPRQKITTEEEATALL